MGSPPCAIFRYPDDLRNIVQQCAKEGEPDEHVNLLFKVFHQSMIQNINDRKLRKLLLAYFTIVFFDRDDQQQDPSP